MVFVGTTVISQTKSVVVSAAKLDARQLEYVLMLYFI